MSLPSKDTVLLFCRSCGRHNGAGPNGVNAVTYLEQQWCAECARVGDVNGRLYVDQPSPGRMFEGAADVLEIWEDCFSTQPKKRITVKVARKEIQRAWEMWDGDKKAVMAKMFFFTWLQRHRPYFLTFRSKYDPWQSVHSWLVQIDGPDPV